MSMLDDIMELKRRMAARPPAAIQIWFVDRLADYHRMLSYCKQVDSVRPKSLYTIPPPFGLPIFNVESAAYNDSLPTFCMVPGIGAVMSDGSFEWVEE